MSKILLDKSKLEAGDILSFETIDKDELRGCSIDKTGRGDFRIWFNGKFIHICKTFASLQKRFDNLNEKWKLEAVTLNDID